MRSKGLPVGAGLGSSGALSVSTAAALLRLVSDDHLPSGAPPRHYLEAINEWAFAAEVGLTFCGPFFPRSFSSFQNVGMLSAR